MPEHIFNSRDKIYKSKYGAVAVNSTFTLRLLLPEQYGGLNVQSATVVFIREDGQEERRFEFSKTEEQYVSSYFWAVDCSPSRPGLYWYYFEFVAGGYKHTICKGKYSTGYVDSTDEKWQLTVYSGEQVVANKWKGGIMYQIFPDRFKNSGSKKIMPADSKAVPWNSTPEWAPDKDTGLWNTDYFGGDLKGIESELPYLASLGVDIIYLNPIFEAHSNHRYNTADYQHVDPILGREEDFIDLCASAHKLGMKVILDGVFSHTGDDSIYFNKYNHYSSVGAFQSKDSPYYSWYKFENWPNQYKSWWGIKLLPEIIEETPSYINFIAGEGGIIEKWLLLGADGWRLDVADELPDEFIVKIRNRIKAVKPDALLLGEVWEDASNKTAYGVRRKYLLGSELDSVMNYPFRDAILDYIVNDNAEDFFEKILTITENYPKQILDSLMNPLGTHDTVRIITRLAGYDCENMSRDEQAKLTLLDEEREDAKKLLKIAAILQYTLPGFPSIYYGDEIGLDGGKDPFNRKSFTWDKIDEELLSFYRELGDMRKHKSYVFADASFVPVSAAAGVICYERRKTGQWNDSYSIVVLVNRGNDTINYSLPSDMTDITPILKSKGVEVAEGFVRLPEKSYLLLENVPVIKKTYLKGSQI
ncbi:MAG: glycoside hydrolase family 13 protein [Clostridia bacterium]|nr:glycoside hydrolase family 13 protein [Clostridia bacterium]